MKTTLVTEPKNPRLAKLDKDIFEYLKKQDLDDFDGNMSIAILETHDLENFSPFRTIETEGLGEFMSTCLHLESLGLTCINKNSIHAIEGYDSVFVPDEAVV
ncbi:hypothetical protein MADA3029_1010007 [Vibrio nigripulchritudo MADA3029]|uniref:hypothetical protein n=1 Tax=Vibrio nigripulchritudo TaxID=28173 RepID=UPI0003B1C950|nr:hypothetical protein [Vibrio nigripulchritudo]CCN48928.1 hypothetical protein VIBNIMADA3020_660007 [Vibrio nigripulchritudo MADA3020]CCN53214.1 hypothetical protein VIBNIMADA3021_220007 [Vibrio nigripulchritudo MADA3021]CCN56816.1 hypothetical protein MADA3029_1010007 [Vibrio nigripulchritudo MADA3029]